MYRGVVSVCAVCVCASVRVWASVGVRVWVRVWERESVCVCVYVVWNPPAGLAFMSSRLTYGHSRESALLASAGLEPEVTVSVFPLKVIRSVSAFSTERDKHTCDWSTFMFPFKPFQEYLLIWEVKMSVRGPTQFILHVKIAANDSIVTTLSASVGKLRWRELTHTTKHWPVHESITWLKTHSTDSLNSKQKEMAK